MKKCFFTNGYKYFCRKEKSHFYWLSRLATSLCAGSFYQHKRRSNWKWVHFLYYLLCNNYILIEIYIFLLYTKGSKTIFEDKILIDCALNVWYIDHTSKSASVQLTLYISVNNSQGRANYENNGGLSIFFVTQF